MSSDYLYPAQDGLMDDYPAKPVSPKIEKGLKRLLIIAGTIIAAECVWLFCISPCIPFSTIEVKGFPGFDGPEVLSAAGIYEGASFISVNARTAEKLLASHYLVESVRVIKRFPDRLTVFLEPRLPVAMSLTPIQGRLVPLFFDRHGIVLKVGMARGETLPENLPLISGITFDDPFPGLRLPATVRPLLAQLGAINTGSPELLGAFSEIQLAGKAYNGFDVILYPVHYPIRIRLDKNFSEDTLRYVLLMLDVFKSGNSFPDEIDFRSGIGVYKVKEARSGE
ncbi:MAG: FtsQ-type POTRA domain-containing protein [Treponema sp.]|jgi:cell division protein FtsQ|nr:FtsQ-type POTRA domain-containing protein [Treponema sp.]